MPALMAFFPARISGIKFLFDTRGLLADKYVGGGLLKKDSFVYKLMRWGEDFLVKRADYFTVETMRHAELINNLGNGILKRIETIPSCVDINKFDYHRYRDSHNSRRERVDLVYLGKTGTWYLIEEMLDFFNVMSKKLNNSYFTFITQDNSTELYSLVKRKKIPLDKIIVKKPQMAEIPFFLANADIGIFFINPYKRYNSSPIKYGEYLASGLPIVINSGIGYTDIITEQENVGIVIREFSPDAYEIAVNKLLSLLRDKNDLKQHCREVAKKYLSLEMGIDKYLQIYQKLSLASKL
jgi:glycosyltransferase involved in cell wall biosynthesis